MIGVLLLTVAAVFVGYELTRPRESVAADATTSAEARAAICADWFDGDEQFCDAQLSKLRKLWNEADPAEREDARGTIVEACDAMSGGIYNHDECNALADDALRYLRLRELEE